MKRKDTYNQLKGTIQAEAIIERIEEIIKQIETIDGLNPHDIDVRAEVLGRQYAKKSLNTLIRELKKENKVERKFDYS